VTNERIGELLVPLLKRFQGNRKGPLLSRDQVEIYCSRLRHYHPEALKDAVEYLVDNSKVFPTPGEIREAVKQKTHERNKSGRVSIENRWCPNCHHGYVFYERIRGDRYAMYPAPCAHCYKGQTGPVPYLVQRDDRIFYACEKYHENGLTQYRATPDIEEPFEDAEPLRTSAWLREYYHGKPTRPDLPARRAINESRRHIKENSDMMQPNP